MGSETINKPLVSVIINCWNGEKYLREAIDSVYLQTYANWEIIFWDNASTDKSAEIARSYDKRLCYFRGDETIPLGAARNRAIDKAKGEFIAFLDCDDLWMARKLEKQIPLFQADRDVAIVTSNAVRFNDRGDNTLFCKVKPKVGYVFKELLTGYPICLSATVISKRAINDFSEWFDPRFSHIEELELFARIAYKWNLGYVDEPLAKNRIHKESSSYLRPDLSPKETEMMLVKFVNLYPNFEREYSEEVMNLKYYIQYYLALLDWKQGNNYIVRKRLKPFLGKVHRAIIPFLFSFFPYRVYKMSYDLFNKHIRKNTMA